MEKLLEVKNLCVNFGTYGGEVKAVRGVTFDLHKGETLAIVGESGSGKSVACKTIMRILSSNGYIKDGQILFDGKDLTKVSEIHYICPLGGDTFLKAPTIALE